MVNRLVRISLILVLFIVLAGLSGPTTFTVEGNTQGENIPMIDQREYEEVNTATFALGCFWGGDARFGAEPGVIRTRVGYAGGSKEDPTYYNLGDHTESIQVDFNPEEISFEELVRIFWNTHDPSSRSYSTQYANILFYHNERQKMIAERTKAELAENSDKEVYTEIKKIEKFYPAEAYHQKYRLRQSNPFIGIMKDIYPEEEDLRDSTAAARLNGFLAGHGTPEEVEQVADKLGLTDPAREKLLDRYGLKGS